MKFNRSLVFIGSGLIFGVAFTNAGPQGAHVSSIRDLRRLSDSRIEDIRLSTRIHRLFKEETPEDWDQFSGLMPAKLEVFIPFYKLLKELNSNPSFIRDWRWRQVAVWILLDPSVQFSKVRRGTFLMGACARPISEDSRQSPCNGELPTWVRVGKPGVEMRIQRTPVTQLLWVLVMGNNPSAFKTRNDCPEDYLNFGGFSCCPRNPVEKVSWNEIAARDEDGNYRVGTFLRTLKDEFGIDAQLPTEAVWEKAARGDPRSPYFYSSHSFKSGSLEEINRQVWWFSNSSGHTHGVGKKGWNSLGLADMGGNVNEWVEDWYASYPGRTSRSVPLKNPKGPDQATFRVARGGSYDSAHEMFIRNSARSYWLPGSHHRSVGFRLVIELPQH